MESDEEHERLTKDDNSDIHGAKYAELVCFLE